MQINTHIIQRGDGRSVQIDIEDIDNRRRGVARLVTFAGETINIVQRDYLSIDFSDDHIVEDLDDLVNFGIIFDIY